VGSDEGLVQLARQFQAFLVRVTRHPIMAHSQSLKFFLEETQEEYRERRKADEAKSTSSSSSLFSASTSTSSSKDASLQKLLVELQDFERILKQLQDHAQKLKTKHKEFSSEFEKWSKDLGRMASTQSIRSPVSNFQMDNKILNRFSKFTLSMTATAKNIEIQANTDEAILYERVKDWVRYTKAAQQLVHRYGESTDKYNLAQSDLTKKKSILDQYLSKTRGGQSASDTVKLQKAQGEMITAQEEYERAREIYDKTQAEFWNEMSRFDRFKSLEVNHWMEYYSQCQMKELSSSFKTWSTFVKENI